MDTIKEALKERDNLPFILSVAMGKATKYKPEESLDDLISLADQQMYEDKKQIKSQNTRFIK
jgi:GGDEF domain-containing protein